MEGKKSRAPGQNCQAVSEVYGQILMVVVTIILAASLIYPNIPESPPRANLLIEARNFTQNETTSGDEAAPSNETASDDKEVPDNKTTSGDYLLEASSGPGGNISPSGKTYALRGSNVTFNMMPDANYKVLDVLVDGASVGSVPSYPFNNISSNHSIHVNFTVDFDVINNNTVVPKGNFTVNATVLGTAFMRDIWVNNYLIGHRESVPFPITCRLKIGNYMYDPWGDYTDPSKGNINDKKNPRFWRSNNTSASTSVTVEACSWEYIEPDNGNNNGNNGQRKILEVSTLTHPSNLKVLRNGDRVPNIHGFQNQDSIEKYVKRYIENRRIKLKENEAIYLFELGNTDLSSTGADFQDLVVLISINGTDTSQSVVSSKKTVSSQETASSQETSFFSGNSFLSRDSFFSGDRSFSGDSPQDTISKLVIEHLGGDTINFKSPEETKVILQKGDEQRYLDFTELGVFKVGDSAIIDPKDYYGNRLNFSEGDSLSIKIVDVRSKSLIYSGSTTVK